MVAGPLRERPPGPPGDRLDVVHGLGDAVRAGPQPTGGGGGDERAAWKLRIIVDGLLAQS